MVVTKEDLIERISNYKVAAEKALQTHFANLGAMESAQELLDLLEKEESKDA